MDEILRAVGEAVNTLMEKLFKRWEGLSLAVVILGFFLAQTYMREGQVPEGQVATKLFFTLLIWLAAIVFHWLGTYLDKPIYDSLFGVKGKFHEVMDEFRRGVRQKFDDLGWQTSALQATSKTLFERSEKWEKNVKTSYEISKAARTFILPLVALLCYQIASLFCNHIPVFAPGLFFGRPYVIAALLVLAVALYLRLRVRHNRALYKLVAEARKVSFAKEGGEQTMLHIETLPGPQDSGVSYPFYCRRDEKQNGRIGPASHRDHEGLEA
jgi:hypothetical protein